MCEHESFSTRFVLPERGVRGQIVRLADAWQTVRSRAVYPAAVENALGESLAVTAALSRLIKFKGSIIFQVQDRHGSSPVSALVAQATDSGTLRGLARFDANACVDQADWVDLVGRASNLVMTINCEQNTRYQGIVSVSEEGVAATVQDYFLQSEQLPTRIWLAVNEERAACFLLQQLPAPKAGPEVVAEDWQHVTVLADTLTKGELLGLSSEAILHRLFHQELVQEGDYERLRFACGCSQEKAASAILAIGKKEAEEQLAEKKEIRVDCEFCNQSYRFDSLDISALFRSSTSTLHSGSAQIH